MASFEYCKTIMAGFEYCTDIDFNKFVINKSDIENLLPHWKTKINEIYQYKSNNGIEINFIVAAKSESDVQQWLHDYESKTKCSYSIRSTDTCSGKKVILKRRLLCQHNTRTTNNKVYDPSARNRTKNTNCPSSINITLRALPKGHRGYRGQDKTKAPNPDMPCEIRLIPYHNHPTLSAEALRFRRVSDDTKQKLIKLFESGHSPASALESIKMDIQMEYDDHIEILADRNICPDYMYCYHMYMKTFKVKYCPLLEISHAFLKQKVEEFNQDMKIKSAEIQFINEDYVICLCPPLMQRVHETVEEASDRIFIDSAGTVDGHCIFILLTATGCGGLPLAIFLTTSESSNLISIGFQLLKKIMGNRIFHGSVNGPTLFISDDSAAEQAAIQSEWPKSTHLLCIFHVLQSIWRWVMGAKNGVKQEHRHMIFEEFRSIMYANNEEDCKAAFQVALTSSKQYPEYQEYLHNYWTQRTLWALCYRNSARHGHNTNDISEAAMRLLKEKIFTRIKAFNVVQLLDFMMNKFVLYYEKSLLDAVHNRTRKNLLHRLVSRLPPTDIVKRIQHVTDSIHLVLSESDSNLSYIVNTEVLICTCIHGRTGHMCKHIDWICCFVNSEKFIKKIDDDRMRRTYFFIATGNEAPKNWLTLPCGSSSSPPHEIIRIIVEAPEDQGYSKNNLENVEISHEPSIHSPMESEEDENEEQCLLKGNKSINEIQKKISHYLERSPLEVSKALEVFENQLDEITVSEFISACLTFSGTSRKNNRRCKIPIQPTAVSSRKSNLSGKTASVGGRSRKSSTRAKTTRKPAFAKKSCNNNASSCDTLFEQ